MNKSKTVLLLKDHLDIINSDNTTSEFFKKKSTILLAILYNRQFNFKSYNGYPVEMIARHLKLKNSQAIEILNYLIDKQLIHRGNGYNTGINGKQAVSKSITLITDSMLYSTNTIPYNYESKNYKKKYKTAMEAITANNNSKIEDILTTILDELVIDYNELDKLMSLEEYTDEYKRYIESSLKAKSHNISISDKTKRLYSIATQFGGTILTNSATLDGEKLTSIDFSNMHPAIFANMLKNKINTEDFKLFYKHATEGTFYKFLADTLNIDEKLIKTDIWMIGIYGDESTKMKYSDNEIVSIRENKYSKLLATVFPSFIEWVDEYKRTNKNTNIAIYIQSKESKLMLDNILNTLYDNGIKAIPRHDEIVFKTSQYAEVELIIKNILKTSNLLINIKKPKDIIVEQIDVVGNTNITIYNDDKSTSTYIYTRFDYVEYIKANFYSAFSSKQFLMKKELILNILVESQVKKKSEIKLIIKNNI